MLKHIAQRISNYNRTRKFSIFINRFKPSVHDRILDVGANDFEYSSSDNMLEKLYENKGNITVLGLHTYDNFRRRYPEIGTVTYDGGEFPFKDKEFDICWSNAVLEHVGGFNQQVLFVKKILRTSNRAFITTPNRFFPFEVHTRIPLLHYLPKKYFDKILHTMKKGWAAGEYMHLLSRRELIKVLTEAGVKKYKIHKNKILFFTIDFIVFIEG